MRGEASTKNPGEGIHRLTWDPVGNSLLGEEEGEGNQPDHKINLLRLIRGKPSSPTCNPGDDRKTNCLAYVKGGGFFWKKIRNRGGGYRMGHLYFAVLVRPKLGRIISKKKAINKIITTAV